MNKDGHTMQSALQRAILVLLICILSGGHWAVLQGVAWTGMIVDYSRDATLLEGVRKTFDGQNPCDMCRAIQRSITDEAAQPDEPAPAPHDIRLTCLLPATARVHAPHPSSCRRDACDSLAISEASDEPPVPPPRRLA
jgi:hypothetical protein